MGLLLIGAKEVDEAAGVASLLAEGFTLRGGLSECDVVLLGAGEAVPLVVGAAIDLVEDGGGCERLEDEVLLVAID